MLNACRSISGTATLRRISRTHLQTSSVPFVGGARVVDLSRRMPFSTFEPRDLGNHQYQQQAFSTNSRQATGSEVDPVEGRLLEVMSEQQMQTNATTIPWFMENMPESYFRQIPDEMRTQHLIAISAIKTLAQGNNLTLNIRSPETNGKTDITVMKTESKVRLEHSPLVLLLSACESSRVHLFDNAIFLYLYTDWNSL